jgi:hypothetical protein
MTRFKHSSLARLSAGLLSFVAAAALASASPKVTPAKDIIGFTIGDDYHVANYTQISTLLKKWESESDRLKVVNIGLTEEGRPQYMAIVTSAENHKKLGFYKKTSQDLSRARLGETEARKLSKEAKTVVWIDGGLHATETVNSQSLVETVYRLISQDSEEVRQVLDSTIAILPIANPDGVELAANWYMRNPDETKRTLQGLPRLYEKYAGHDNNRDSIIMNLKETINQNRVLYIEWNPQLMMNVHQSGPAGTVVFIPPFRDPYNYNYDPLIPLGIQQAGAALHARLVSKGLGGSVARSLAPYSTWANGGIRYATYFRNQIGLMTEIFGNPTPSVLPLVADRQLANGDGPLPVRPGLWHYSQSINYQTEINIGLLAYAAVNREQLLYNIYAMGRNSIQRGSQDSWTITPKRIDALKAAGKAAGADSPGGRRGTATAAATQATDEDGPAALGGRGTLPVELYEKVLHDPAFRDPRGYVIGADQEDFPTAVKFVNSLLKGGVEVQKATTAFEVRGKKYPAGSYIVKAAQAFRPVVLDSFEPLDHPTDLEYPGGPPKKPYDIAGWTLAAQLAVQFDRVYEDFTGPFKQLSFDLEPAPQSSISGVANPAGFLISHRINDAFIVTNRLLKAGADVYWLKDELTVEGRAYAPGTIWVPASDKARELIATAAHDLGVPALGVARKPSGDALKLQPVRIGLIDVYGGSMPSGWTRWLFEKYEFPFEVVYPQTIDAGNLKAKFDVIVVPSGLYSEGRGGRGGRGGPPLDPQSIPEEYRARLGSVTPAKSAPALKAFVDEGGTVVAVGTSSQLGKALGLPLNDHLVDKDSDGKERHLPSEKFYVPGSVLRASFNTKTPLAYGLSEKGYVFFQASPTFARSSETPANAAKVAWFDDAAPLYSGWALGQEYLLNGEIATEASVGKGKVALLGIEATFRGTPHGTFKLLFNGVYLGSTSSATQL